MSATTLRFLQQENARLQQEIETLRAENQALHKYMDALKDLYWANQKITSEETLWGLLDQILSNALNVVGAEDGSLLLVDEETDELAFVLVHGDVGQKLRGYRISRNTGIAGWVASHYEPLIVNNPRQDKRFSPQVDELFGFETRSILCVPMIGRWKLIGVIELLNKNDGGVEFTETDATIALILANVAAIALDDMQARLDAEESAEKVGA